MARDGRCQLVEGRVEQYQPMPSAGNGLESFVVGGRRFNYSDFAITDGFNDTAAHGGPIKDGEYVRICYDPRGNVILRLEIRGFAGQVKDYSRIQNFFPQAASSNQNVPATEAPLVFRWVGNIIFVPVLIDFALITMLFRPYLRTFIRLKRVVPASQVAISAAVHLNIRIKLSNTLIR